MPRKPRPSNNPVRVERDTLGEVSIPTTALYGPQTQRALENFPLHHHHFSPNFIRALALIKACAAAANSELGLLPPSLAARIEQAANDIANGAHHDQFVLSIFQTGSGTSTNMNANEVIAHLSGAHPNDHVNCSQSSNDVIPSAIHIAAARQLHGELIPAVQALHTTLERKATEFWEVHKIGRTHLQDATPIRLGQEFSGYAHQVRASQERITFAAEGLLELPLGGTAVGTGLNAPPGFAPRTINQISQRTGIDFREARNHFEAQAAKDAIAFLSGALKSYAIALTKICNDLRWLGSGPRAGLAEIVIPALQPGSSMMPGKVNPVIPESVLMICAQVIGHDAAIAWGCASGTFELNVMMPLLAFNLLDGIELLTSATHSLTERCINGITANTQKTTEQVERSLALATALVPAIGYDRAAAVAKEAFATGKTIREVAIETSGLTAQRVSELLDAAE